MFNILLGIGIVAIAMKLFFWCFNYSFLELSEDIMDWLEKKRDKSSSYDDDYLSQYKDWGDPKDPLPPRYRTRRDDYDHWSVD